MLLYKKIVAHDFRNDPRSLWRRCEAFYGDTFVMNVTNIRVLYQQINFRIRGFLPVMTSWSAPFNCCWVSFFTSWIRANERTYNFICWRNSPEISPYCILYEFLLGDPFRNNSPIPREKVCWQKAHSLKLTPTTITVLTSGTRKEQHLTLI